MSNNWELNHVGIVVNNKNRILHHLQSIGVGLSVGPQPLLPYIEGDTTLTMYRELHGNPVTSTSKTQGAHTFYDGECQIGTLQLECIAPGETGTFISAYLKTKGEGINHLCFNVPDVAEETERLLAKGCNLVFSVSTGGQIIENYLDTRDHGDVIISFRPPAGDWERQWKQNNLADSRVNDWQFRGVGVPVRDLDKTIEYYQFLGFSAQEESVLASGSCPSFTVGSREPESPIEVRSRKVAVGPLLYDFVQPVEGDSIYTESLARRGDGINSIDFTVSDLEAEKARLSDRGAAVLMEGAPEGDAAFVYFDTREVGSIVVKLVQG